MRGKVYPEGPWGPESNTQWGAIIYDWLGQGDPFTFHWKQQPDGGWVEGPQRDRQLPRIPSMPLNSRNAAAILKQLGGPEAPKDWQGGLPLTYRIGPGPVTLTWTCRTTSASGNCAASSERSAGAKNRRRW